MATSHVRNTVGIGTLIAIVTVGLSISGAQRASGEHDGTIKVKVGNNSDNIALMSPQVARIPVIANDVMHIKEAMTEDDVREAVDATQFKSISVDIGTIKGDLRVITTILEREFGQ